MKIQNKEEIKLKIKDLVKNYYNDEINNEAVTAYNGSLNVRPAYQREFTYNEDQQRAVINSILGYLPLNLIYWEIKEDGKFNLLDGQQRILSICRFYNNQYYIIRDKNKKLKYLNLTTELKEKFENYELTVFKIKDTKDKIKELFHCINTYGKKFNEQETLNSIYEGEWINQIRFKFSKPNCDAFKLGKKYVKGNYIEQDYLRKAMRWISLDKIDKKEYTNDSQRIEEYIRRNYKKNNYNELWHYFENVIEWVRRILPKYHKDMKEIEWGEKYNKFKDKFDNENFDPDKLQEEIKKLREDHDVKRKWGIYNYIFDGNETHLDIRDFEEADKIQKFKEQDGKCNICNETFEIDKLEKDHILPWSRGGKTRIENLQLLCKPCNSSKGNR